MTIKRFLIYRLILTMILAGIVSFSISINNYLVPIATVATFVILFYAMRKKIKGVMEDERDYELAGKAARYAMTIFASIVGLVVIILFAQRQANPIYEIVGSALAYAVCGLLLAYSVLFKYFQSRGK